jgi:thiamine pyrophosphate-dependent acetolactate synthase large subunit-like protein
VLEAFAQAATQAGIPASTDFNTGDNHGVGYFEVNQKSGWRWNTAKAFLRPTCYGRPNFELWTGAQVARLLLAPASQEAPLRCTGVQVWNGREMVQAHARAEVLLCAGSVATPQILQLSGLGPAELLQAKVVDQGSRMNFPRTHYLTAPATAIANADVIIGLELSDFWATVNAYTDNNSNDGHGTNASRIKPQTKLISINSVDLNTKSNYQDFQRFQVVDVQMAADAQTTLPSLIEAVRSALPNDKKEAIAKRGELQRKAYEEDIVRTKTAAALGWNESPISTARLVMETFAAVKNEDWSLVASEGNVSNWPNRLWPMEKHHHWLGRSGGYGVGYGAPASVGAALANRDLGRFSVSIQSDGDLMFAPGVLWTAAKHKIPLLSVMHNNRGYHQEVMHIQRLANFRNRKVNLEGDMGPVGTSIENPDIQYHELARSMGWWAKGPIKDPAQLASALKEAVAVVKSGHPALLNVWTQPR